MLIFIVNASSAAFSGDVSICRWRFVVFIDGTSVRLCNVGSLFSWFGCFILGCSRLIFQIVKLSEYFWMFDQNSE